MTPEQSKKLKVGSRICFNGDPADRGKVTSIEAKYVTIKWRDGHRSLTGHDAMDRVELVDIRRSSLRPKAALAVGRAQVERLQIV